MSDTNIYTDIPNRRRFSLSTTPYIVSIKTEAGNYIVLYFSSAGRKATFERKFPDVAENVKNVTRSRYHGVLLDTGELAALDLYARIETTDRRIKYLDAFGVERELKTGDCITVKLMIR